VYYTDTTSIDFAPPIIWAAESLSFGGETNFGVITQDSSGIQRVLMAYTENGTDWQTQDFEPNPFLEDRWETRMTNTGDQFIYFIQVVDGAGNVTVTANKGLFFRPTRNDVYLPMITRNH
jgi:hypothetical protein